MCETPSPGPIKKSTRKQSFQLIQVALQFFKSMSILLLPNKPHQTSWNHVPNIRAVFTKVISPAKWHNLPNPKTFEAHLPTKQKQYQQIKRSSTVSPLLQHRQHQLTNDKPFFLRLSKVRIFPNAAVHKKNDTLLGTLMNQIPLQGKGTIVAP